MSPCDVNGRLCVTRRQSGDLPAWRLACLLVWGQATLAGHTGEPSAQLPRSSLAPASPPALRSAVHLVRIPRLGVFAPDGALGQQCRRPRLQRAQHLSCSLSSCHARVGLASALPSPSVVKTRCPSSDARRARCTLVCAVEQARHTLPVAAVPSSLPASRGPTAKSPTRGAPFSMP